MVKKVVKNISTATKKATRKLNKHTKKATKSVKNFSKGTAHSRRIKKDKRARTKAEQLAKLPKSRFKRLAYYLNPKRLFKFWFSKEGLILSLKIAGAGVAVFVFVAISLFAYYRRDIEADPKHLRASLLEQTTKFYDKTGKEEIYSVHGDTNRTWVELEDISEFAQHATVAIEDKDFYNHGGFSLSGVVRAAVSNVLGGSDNGTQGGSTITQQFVKNAFLSREKTITRKIKELILALEMERLYTKDEILEFYLNQIPYGGTEYGIQAAAQSFFEKDASKLTIAEAAMLASLPQQPSVLSPYKEDNNQLLIDRQRTVIFAMQDQGYITTEQRDKALDEDFLAKVIPLEEKNQFSALIAPHFVVEVQRQLEEIFTESLVVSGGLKVTTTLDTKLQKIANKAVTQNMSTVVSPPSGGSGDNAALVSVDNETGQVVAMVGSRRYSYPGFGAFNAALAERQPGSSFKPFDYAQLFYNDRWGPDSLIYDVNVSFGNYKPKNYDFGFKGTIKIREAIGMSRNIPAVKAMYITGVAPVIELSRSMGNLSLGNPDNLGLAAALGAGEVKLAEHVNAYATFARGGIYKELSYILKVESASGEVLYPFEDPVSEEVLDPQIAYLITDILQDDNARSRVFGYNNPNLVVRGLNHTTKTGTTNDAVDGWMMGYTKYLTVGVWVGNHDNAAMQSISSQQTGPIYTQYLREAHADLKNVPIMARPAGIKSIKIDSNTGYVATSKSKKTHNGIFASWYVPQVAEGKESEYTIDTVSKKLATSCTPDLAKETVKSTTKWPELLSTDPAYPIWARAGGYSTAGGAPKENDDVHKCNDTKPAISIEVDSKGSGVYEIKAVVAKGKASLKTLQFKADGQIVDNRSISSSGTYTYDYIATKNGSVKFTVVVIDSLLYSAQNSKTESVNSASLILSSPSDGDPANSIVFSWNSLSGATTYKVCWDPKQGPKECKTTVSTSWGESLDSGMEYEAEVTAYFGASKITTSPTIVFTPS